MSTSDKINKLFAEESDEERIRRRDEDEEKGIIVLSENGRDVIKESNRLVASCYTMSEVEQKLMYCFIRQIQKDKEIQRYTIPVSEIQKICNFDRTKYHSVVMQAADKLLSRVVTIYSEDKKKWFKTHWLSFIKYADGKVTFEFERFLQEDLLELKSKFTIFDVRVPMKLTGTYAPRLYMLLKSLQHLNTSLHIITVDELRHAFELSASMSPAAKIRQRIIEPSLEQINNVTDLNVKYKPINVGKTIKSFQFIIKENKKFKKETDTVETTAEDVTPTSLWENSPQSADTTSEEQPKSARSTDATDELYTLVKDYGVGIKLFKNTLGDIPIETQEAAVKYAVHIYNTDAKNGKVIKNPAAYIVGTIKNYDPTAAITPQRSQRTELSEEEQEALQRIMSESNTETRTGTPSDMKKGDDLKKMTAEEIQNYYDNLPAAKKSIMKIMIKRELPEIAETIKF